MKKLVLLSFVLFPVTGFAQVFIGELSGRDSVQMTLPELNLTLGYVHSGERFVCEKGIFQNDSLVRITFSNGRAGYIPVQYCKRAQDTTLFKITYTEDQFPFYPDTTIMPRLAHEPYGWEGIFWWMGYTFGDTMNVPYWTAHAYAGERSAMRTILLNDFGDVHAASQYEFNLWKLINRWNDANLALLLMDLQDSTGNDPESSMMYAPATPFYQNKRMLEEYYRLYYPFCYELILLDREPLNVREKKKKKLRKRLEKEVLKHPANTG